MDSTGLETRHISTYFVWRRGERGHRCLRWPKLTIVGHTASHLIAAATATEGPSNDGPEFFPVLQAAARRVRLGTVLADAAYDGEHNHVLCRETLRISRTIIPINRRNSGRRWPRSKYRRQMRRRFHRRRYGQRWHVESIFSQFKRLLGSSLRARTTATQRWECLLRVLSFDLMVLERHW